MSKGQITKYFNYLKERSAAADLPWQDTLTSTRAYMHKIWEKMTVSERIEFNSTWGAIWAVWRHPLPFEVFTQLESHVNDKTLHFHKLTSPVSCKKGTFSFTNASGEEIKSQFLWDGTGGNNKVKNTKHLLLKSLLKQGLVEPHPCGGLSLNPSTMQCRTRYGDTLNLYNIGPLSKGELFSTNAFWFNCYCASIVVKQLKQNNK